MSVRLKGTRELIHDVLGLYGQAMEAGTLVAQLDPALPIIEGDATLLRQVVHNLLQNAQDATEAKAAGQVAAPVVLKTQWSATNRRVRMTVQDSGGGFPDNILARAFEPYVTTKAKGTGLGLAVVKKIADEHGTRVDIANRLENERVAGAQVSLSFEAAPAATI